MNSKISRAIKKWLGGNKTTPNEFQRNGSLAISQHRVKHEIVPLVEGLFEQARLKWQCGDWNSLALLKIEDIENDPERGKLAALVAAAHQQKKNDLATQDFLRLAKDWGCHPKYIARILIAGVYETLGKAAIITGQSGRALSLFERAVTTSTNTGDTGMLAAVRGESQVKQLSSSIKLKTASATLLRSVASEEFLSKKEFLGSDSGNIVACDNTTAFEIQKLRDDVRLAVRNEIAKSTKQLEAFINIQSYLVNGEIVPELHGWPISPDIALYLIQIVSSEGYDIVVEFGSGTSTFLIAKTLQRTSVANIRDTKQVAFEHLEEFHTKTFKELSYRNLSNEVDLELSPLVIYAGSDGKDYLYYSCEEYLSRLSMQISKEDLKILVLVDGPPGSTGKHARYPALPIMISHFPLAEIDFIIDDYDRSDEQEVLKKWTAEINADYNFSIQEKKFEKGACLLKTKRKSL